MMHKPSAYVRAKLPRSCLTLCDPSDCSPSGFSIHGILQARTLGWGPRGRAHAPYISCVGRQVGSLWCHRGNPYYPPCCCCCCCWVASAVSDCVRPHRRQPTRLCCPWGSPGKNSGVGCYFLLQCMKVIGYYKILSIAPNAIYSSLSIFFFFLYTALLISTSHILQFNHLKCAVQWFWYKHGS